MDNCIFCQIAKGEAKAWRVFENEHVCAFFDWNPANAFHTLVIPKKHYKDIFDISERESKEIIIAIKKITALYKEKLGIENLQIVNSSGADAQQEVFHIHFHIVPRYKGDGQDIQWKPRPELREQYDEMLGRLK